MSTDTRELHRTFEIIRSSGKMLDQAAMARDIARELNEAKAKYRGLPDAQALDLLRADKMAEAEKLPVFDAVEDLGGGRSQYVQIRERKGQNFEKVATRWEMVWSRLVSRYGSRLTPVVDSTGLVISYLGNVEHNYLLIEKGGPTALSSMSSADVLKNYRLFVGTNAFFGRSDLQEFGDNIITTHTVSVNIDGEVDWYIIGKYRDDSIVKVGLLEIWGAITFTRSILGIVKAVGKAGIRTLIRRPPA